MKTRRQQIDELIQELYVKKYRERINVLCSMDDLVFKSYILRDWRFKSIYGSYIIKSQDNINIEQFYTQKIDTLYRFVYDSLLDMPNEIKPSQIYLDEKYTFTFEVLKDYAPDYDDFIINVNRRHLRKNSKYFNKITTSELQERLINDLKNKIKLLDEQDELERNKNKVKMILKYDKNGNLLEKYYSRQECIDKNDLTKAGLSQHLNGKRKSLKGFVYKEVIYYQ